MRLKLHVICDTSFLSVMHDLHYLKLCPEVFDKAYIPKSVYGELERSGISPLMASVKQFISEGFVAVRICSNLPLVNSLKSFLGGGEAEAIALAFELEEADVIILDDLKARRVYDRLNAAKRLIGTIGVLKFMLARQVINDPVDEVMDKLEQAGFHFKKDLFKK